MIDKKVYMSICKLVDYLEHDEKKDYDSYDKGSHRRGHIYNDVKKVKSWALQYIIKGRNK